MIGNNELDAKFNNGGFYLPDGTYEPMFDPENDLSRLIREHLGLDAELYFKALLASAFRKDYEEVFEDLSNAACEVDSAIDMLEISIETDCLNEGDVREVITDLKNLYENTLNKYW